MTEIGLENKSEVDGAISILSLKYQDLRTVTEREIPLPIRTERAETCELLSKAPLISIKSYKTWRQRTLTYQ